MSKHSPAPWIFEPYSRSSATTYYRVRAGNLRVATTHSFEGSPAQELANARLLAAAPELLVACEIVKRWFDERPDEDHPCDEFLSATIAKATGSPATTSPPRGAIR